MTLGRRAFLVIVHTGSKVVVIEDLVTRERFSVSGRTRIAAVVRRIAEDEQSQSARHRP
jgi:hypothetical protein